MGFWTNPEFQQLAPHVATLPEPADPMHFQLRNAGFWAFDLRPGLWRRAGLWRWRLGVFRIEGPSTWTNFWLKSKSFPHVQQGFSWVPNPWAPPGKQLASACWDGVARIYDLENEVEPMELRGHTGGGVVILFPTRQSPWCFSLRGFFNSKSKVVICCYFPWWVLYQVHNGSHNECPPPGGLYEAPWQRRIFAKQSSKDIVLVWIILS